MNKIKIAPASADDVGMAHPIDGPLAAEGSLWTHDDFTQRALLAGSVRRFEVPTEVPAPSAPSKPGKVSKADAPSIADASAT